ncbi:MAG: hypothetical protein JXQ73_08965 [Phycisphaerae bacterium]|nr:hypothetical protein [Phycisphaerae bacterium]
MRCYLLLLPVLAVILCAGCDLEELVGGPIVVTIHGPETPPTPPPEAEEIELCVGELDFCPPHVRGDRDFKGHGPCVTFKAQLQVNTERNVVEVCVYMKAEEWAGGAPESDYTTARGWSWWLPVKSPPGFKIVGLAEGQETAFWHSYEDDDHELDVFGFSPYRPVGGLAYIGDTSGDDAGVATSVRARFNPIRVLVVEE